MGHNSHTWNSGDVIPANLLNSIETDLAAAAVVADIGTAGTATGDALRAAFVSVLVYSGGAYPARPAGVPGGLVKYIGPVQPTTWLSGDEWVNNS